MLSYSTRLSRRAVTRPPDRPSCDSRRRPGTPRWTRSGRANRVVSRPGPSRRRHLPGVQSSEHPRPRVDPRIDGSTGSVPFRGDRLRIDSGRKPLQVEVHRAQAVAVADDAVLGEERSGPRRAARRPVIAPAAAGVCSAAAGSPAIVVARQDDQQTRAAQPPTGGTETESARGTSPTWCGSLWHPCRPAQSSGCAVLGFSGTWILVVFYIPDSRIWMTRMRSCLPASPRRCCAGEAADLR